MHKLIGVVLTLMLAPPCSATTIAWDGVNLAADSQSTSGHTKFKSAVPKIVRSDARHASMACAGAVAVTVDIKKFFLTSIKPLSEYQLPEAALKADGVFACLVVFDDGSALYYTHRMDDPEPVPAPFAFGTGEDFAMAIMTSGGTAEAAVEVAKQLDLYTGGAVKVVKAPATKK